MCVAITGIIIATIKIFQNNFPLIMLFVIYSFYFIKDIFNGKSIGKMAIGLQVVDIDSGKPASLIKCVLRNLTIIIWPLECIIALFNLDRRLGDYIAGTRLDYYEKK
jgi:uncharacterized RDD family membrane protein YckC